MEWIVITGATSGIGWSAYKSLLKQGYGMIGIGRSDDKIRACREELERSETSEKARFIKADLSSQKDIRRAADETGQLLGENTLYCLINNAGAFAGEYGETDDRIERQLAVNALAPYLMSRLLIPRMDKGSRIITVGSSAHFGARLRWKDPQMMKRYSSLGAYRQSKFFTVLMTNGFNKLYGDTEIRAFIADPGLVNTEIGLKGTRGLPRLVWSIRRKKGQTVEEGAATTVFLAAEKDLPPENGAYYKYCRPFAPDSRTDDDKLIARFMNLAESLC